MAVHRNHVPPPGSALAPNTAPGRLFWDDNGAGEDHLPPPVNAVVNLALPNLTRIAMADQLYGGYLALGNSPATARTLADARALQMIP